MIKFDLKTKLDIFTLWNGRLQALHVSIGYKPVRGKGDEFYSKGYTQNLPTRKSIPTSPTLELRMNVLIAEW